MNPEKLELIKAKARKVLAEFDYEAVHKYMVETNHTWHFRHRLGEEYVDEVPPIEEIKETAEQQMYYAIENVQKTGNSTHCGTGGFHVYIFTSWNGVKLTYEISDFVSKSY